ncbi:MAG: hypothetical protein JWO52_7897, partial [Gammaproteobacteria bacterium]|nr:hypothetical protein [Gammaproteobacteria bacterium]
MTNRSYLATLRYLLLPLLLLAFQA